MNILFKDGSHAISHLSWEGDEPLRASMLIEKNKGTGRVGEPTKGWVKDEKISVELLEKGEYVHLEFSNPKSVEVLIETLQKVKTELIEKQLAKLRYFKDTTINSGATDRPEAIPEDIKELFFKIEA